MSKYCIEMCRKFGVTGVDKLTWYHSCNDIDKLKDALASDVHMIEADISVGTYDPDCFKSAGWSSLMIGGGSSSRKNSKESTNSRNRDNDGVHKVTVKTASGRDLTTPASNKERTILPCVKGKTVIMSHQLTENKVSNLTLEMFLKMICAYNCEVDPKLAQRQESRFKGTFPLDTETEDGNSSWSGNSSWNGGVMTNGAIDHEDGFSVTNTSGMNPNNHNHYDSEELASHLGYGTTVKKRKHALGVKLDFKDKAAVKPAIDLLKKLKAWATLNTVWLNADVCAGPGALPFGNWVMEGHEFLGRCCQIPGVVLSLGWLSLEYTMGTTVYTDQMITDMILLVLHPFLNSKDKITKLTVAQVAEHITFPVQAKFALASEKNLKRLLDLVPGSSLTIYTGVGTLGVDREYLEQIYNTFDTTRLFVDVKTKDGGGSKGADCSLM